MAFVVKDRVKETTTTTGTGTVTLAGAVTGYQSFSVIGDGNDTYYTITLPGSSEWEVGVGQYTASGTTLSRNTVLASSNSNSLVPFSTGTKDVFVVYPADKAVIEDLSNNVTLPASLTVNGPSVVSVNSSSDALRITQTGTGNALVVEDSANPDSTPFVVDASGNVGIGTTSPTAPINVYNATTSQVLVQGDSSTSVQVERYSTDNTAPGFTHRKARGTLASPLSVTSGDISGQVAYAAYGGTNFRSIAAVRGTVGTYTADDNISGDLAFLTRPTGAGAGLNIRMTITGAGDVGIGTTSPTGTLDVVDSTGGSAQLFVRGQAATNIIANRASTDAVGSAFGLRKSRGTLAAPTAVATNDVVGNLLYQGYGGTNVRNIANIQGVVQNYTSDTNISGALAFQTTNAGTTPAEVMRITAAGDVGIGVVSPAAKLETYGTIQARPAATQDAVAIAGRAGGTGSFVATITPTTLSASRTVTLPDASFTVAGLSINNAFTGANTFYNATGQTFGTATSTQDGIIIAGSATGSATRRITVQPAANLSASRTLTLPDPGSNETLGYLNIPQNSQSAAYTLVLTDSGKHILHPSADTTARTFTIPANGTVAFPIGTAVTFINQNGAGVVTIAITTDTMRLAGPGTTGSRTLAANGIATAIKITATEWIISGTGLT